MGNQLLSTMKENVVAVKSYLFAVQIIRLYQSLCKEKREYILSKQILRCGTSIGANVEEAIGGMSKKDFIAKMNISYKEARETNFWLRLLHDTDYLGKAEFIELENKCQELLKLLYTIIHSSKTNN